MSRSAKCKVFGYFIASRFMSVVCCPGAHSFFGEYKSWASIGDDGI